MRLLRGGGALRVLCLGEDIRNVVPRVAVETLLEPLLVKVVANKSNSAAKNKQSVQEAHLQVLVGLLECEASARAEEVDHAHGNAAVDIEDQIRLLGCGDQFHLACKVEQGGRVKVLAAEVANNVDTHIGVADGLDPVAHTHDELVLLAHGIHKLLRREAGVVCLGKLLGGIVKSASKTITDGEKTRAQRRHEVLAGASSDNRVVRPRNGGAVVGSDHEAHFNEFARIRGEAALEPQQAHHTANANILLECGSYGNTSVEKLLTTLVADRRHKRRGLANETKLLRPRVVDGHLRRVRLGALNNHAHLDERCIRLANCVAEAVKAVGHNGAGLLEGEVLGGRCLGHCVGTSTRMTKLDLRRKLVSARADAPADKGLLDASVLNGLADKIFFSATDLSQENHHLDLGIVLKAQQMINKCGSGVAVSTDRNALVHTVGAARDDVIEFVAHATRARNIRDAAGAVQTGRHNVVEHATSVANLKAAWLDSANGRGTNDPHPLLLCRLVHETRLVLGNSLGNDRDDTDLGKLQGLHGALIRRAE
eukprot:Opistho-2@31092